MVKLSVTPVYYPEYRGLLVRLSSELLFNLHLVLVLSLARVNPWKFIFLTHLPMTSCEGCLLFTFVKEN